MFTLWPGLIKKLYAEQPVPPPNGNLYICVICDATGKFIDNDPFYDYVSLITQNYICEFSEVIFVVRLDPKEKNTEKTQDGITKLNLKNSKWANISRTRTVFYTPQFNIMKTEDTVAISPMNSKYFPTLHANIDLLYLGLYLPTKLTEFKVKLILDVNGTHKVLEENENNKISLYDTESFDFQTIKITDRRKFWGSYKPDNIKKGHISDISCAYLKRETITFVISIDDRNKNSYILPS